MTRCIFTGGAYLYPLIFLNKNVHACTSIEIEKNIVQNFLRPNYNIPVKKKSYSCLNSWAAGYTPSYHRI